MSQGNGKPMQVVIQIGIMPDGQLGMTFECDPRQALNAMVQVLETLRTTVAVNEVKAQLDQRIKIPMPGAPGSGLKLL